MSEEKPPLVESEIVYLGTRPLKGGKAGSLFISILRLASALDKGNSRIVIDNHAQTYTGKGTTGHIIGGVYRAKARFGEGNTLDAIQFSGMKFQRRLENEFVAECELADRTAQGDQRAAAQERKIKANPRAMGEIEWLRIARHRTAHSSRAAFDAAVLKLLGEGM